MTVNYSKIAKLSCCIFLFYMFWFKYAFKEINVLLYVLAFIAIACMIMGLISSGKGLLDSCPKGVLINLVMCAYSVLTGLWYAVDPNGMISQLVTCAAFVLVCMVMCYVSSEENSFEWIINTIIIVDIIVFAFVIFHGYYAYGYGYILGPEQNPNKLGIEMDIGLFCLAYKTRKLSRVNLFYLLLSVCFFYCIVGCGSRKALIGAVIFLIMWLVPLYIRNWRKNSIEKKLVLVFVLIAAVIGIYYFYKTVYLHSDVYIRMQTLGDSDEGSSGARIQMYRYAIGYFLERPVFGIGFNQFQAWSPTHGYSHSTYAEAIACWGVVGCAMYFIPVLIAGIKLIKFSCNNKVGYLARMCLALYALEIYVGIGQIWFYEYEHLIAWMLIFLIVDYLQELIGDSQKIIRKYKYVKA